MAGRADAPGRGDPRPTRAAGRLSTSFNTRWPSTPTRSGAQRRAAGRRGGLASPTRTSRRATPLERRLGDRHRHRRDQRRRHAVDASSAVVDEPSVPQVGDVMPVFDTPPRPTHRGVDPIARPTRPCALHADDLRAQVAATEPTAQVAAIIHRYDPAGRAWCRRLLAESPAVRAAERDRSSAAGVGERLAQEVERLQTPITDPAIKELLPRPTELWLSGLGRRARARSSWPRLDDISEHGPELHRAARRSPPERDRRSWPCPDRRRSPAGPRPPAARDRRRRARGPPAAELRAQLKD